MKTQTSRTAVRSAALTAVAAAAIGLLPSAMASSHREAPFIVQNPQVDGTDLYMFRSYETGRAGFVTILANYIPFQDPQGGPNFYMFNPDALYEIHIDNTGAGTEALTFQFQFQNTSKMTALNVGGKQVKIPLIDSGPISGVNPATLNVRETFSLEPGPGRPPYRYALDRDQRNGRRGQLRQAGRQHRRQDLRRHRRVCRLRCPAHLQRQYPGLRDPRQGVRRPAQGTVLHRCRQDLRPFQHQSAWAGSRRQQQRPRRRRTSARSRSSCRSPASRTAPSR